MDQFWKSYAFPDPWPDTGADGAPPEKFLEFMEEAFKMAETTFPDNEKTADGNKWELEKRDSSGMEVYSAKHKTSAARRFRAVGETSGTTPEDVMNVACGKGWAVRADWDDGVSWARALKRFRYPVERGEGWLDVDAFTSAPAAGGAISPRLFVDGRLTKFYRNEEGAVIKGFSVVAGITAAMPFTAACGVDEIERRLAKTKIVRAHTSPACGIRAEVSAGGRTRITVLGHLEIGGWLPSSIVNSATGGAIITTVKGIIKQAQKKTETALSSPAAGAAAAGTPSEAAVAATPMPSSSSSSSTSSSPVVDPEREEQKQRQSSSPPLPECASKVIPRPRSSSRRTIRIRPPGYTDEKWYSWKYADG